MTTKFKISCQNKCPVQMIRKSKVHVHCYNDMNPTQKASKFACFPASPNSGKKQSILTEVEG
jgi:hypothetical protein